MIGLYLLACDSCGATTARFQSPSMQLAERVVCLCFHESTRHTLPAAGVKNPLWLLGEEMDVLISPEINALHTLHGRNCHCFFKRRHRCNAQRSRLYWSASLILDSRCLQTIFQENLSIICRSVTWCEDRSPSASAEAAVPLVKLTLMSAVICCHSSKQCWSNKLFPCCVLSMTEDLRRNFSPRLAWKMCTQLSSPQMCRIYVIHCHVAC